jgi:membrane-bound ClpP family serine protease
MTEKKQDQPVSPRPGWTPILPEKMPEPTFWPAALALGTVLLLWGLVTSFVVGVVGFILLVFSIAGWLREMRHE